MSGAALACTRTPRGCFQLYPSLERMGRGQLRGTNSLSMGTDLQLVEIIRREEVAHHAG